VCRPGSHAAAVLIVGIFLVLGTSASRHPGLSVIPTEVEGSLFGLAIPTHSNPQAQFRGTLRRICRIIISAGELDDRRLAQVMGQREESPDSHRRYLARAGGEGQRAW
jgi:hypothetical protein